MKSELMSNIQHKLTPVQQTALDGLLNGMQAGSLAVLEGDAGAGKTTIFQHLHQIRGGALVGMAAAGPRLAVGA